MKKLIFTLLMMAGCVVISYAQTEQGNMLVGGNLVLNTAKNDARIGLSPSAGYFVLRNLAVGAALQLDYHRISSTNKTTNFGIGPFARYYFGTLNVRPFADAELSIQSNKNKLGSVSTTYNSTQYFLGGGLAAFINRNVAIEGLIGYRHNYAKSLGGSGGLNMRVGFQVYISRGEVESMTR